MGAIGEAIAAFAKPLTDATDGSLEQMQKALSISQLCWNLAILPPDKRADAMNEMVNTLKLSRVNSEVLKYTMILPMVRRHEEMFPQMHQRQSINPPHARPRSSPVYSATTTQEKSVVPGRYDPCSGGSGRKYKFCCGQKA